MMHRTLNILILAFTWLNATNEMSAEGKYGADHVTLQNGTKLPKDIVADVQKVFTEYDKDSNGSISSQELAYVFEDLGERIPGYKLRELIDEVDQDRNGTVEFNEFLELYSKTTEKGMFDQWTSLVSPRQGIQVSGGSSKKSASGTAHTHSESEQTAFRDWINAQLEEDPDLNGVLPIRSNAELCPKLKDGVILCKMINMSINGTIDERTINTGARLNAFLVSENNALAVNSARAIGCSVVNVGAEDISQGRSHLVLGLLWQIIRIGLFANITLQGNPHLAALLEPGESIDDLLKLSPEELLLRWVNYHLKRSGTDARIKNFSTDIKDSEAYAILLHQIASPELGVDRSEQILAQDNLLKRAESIIKNADRLDAKKFVMARDIASGNSKLNLAFVANLFNLHPALDHADVQHLQPDNYIETREEKTYRCWMNSMGVSPYVYHLYNDLESGLILFQLYDIINKGTVNWEKVNKAPFKTISGKMKKVENCNYVVELGREKRYTLVAIGGEDIHNKNKKLVLALVWQMLRDYTVSILKDLSNNPDTPIETQIIEWANKKLRKAGKTNMISSFKDLSIKTSLPVIDLVDAIKPNSVQYDLVTSGDSEEEKDLNANYAISMCRKIGAKTYALPEDLVESSPKMVLTVFACLMTRDLSMQKK